jgi:hypothetical protein
MSEGLQLAASPSTVPYGEAVLRLVSSGDYAIALRGGDPRAVVRPLRLAHPIRSTN